MRKDPWWHVLGLSCGLLFALMLMVARLYPAYFDRLDLAVEKAILPLQTWSYSEPFLVLTVLGSGIGVTALAIGAAYFLRYNRFLVLRLALLLVLSWLSIGIAKAFVERARPIPLTWVVGLHSYSFPSGHAVLSTAFYGFTAVMLYRRSRTIRTQLLSVLIPALIILLICTSRVVLSYHYFTDVVAGVLLGLFWLSLAFMFPQPRSAAQAHR